MLYFVFPAGTLIIILAYFVLKKFKKAREALQKIIDKIFMASIVRIIVSVYIYFAIDSKISEKIIIGNVL